MRAFIAGRLAGRLDQDFLTGSLGVALNLSAVNRAVTGMRWRAAGAKSRGRAAGGPPPASGSAIRDWLHVSSEALDLGVALVDFPAAGARDQVELFKSLQGLDGVVHLLRTGEGPQRRVLALVVTDGETDRRRLRARLDEFSDAWEWTVVDEETVEPAVRTWRHLTLAAARREGLSDRT